VLNASWLADFLLLVVFDEKASEYGQMLIGGKRSILKKKTAIKVSGFTRCDCN